MWISRKKLQELEKKIADLEFAELRKKTDETLKEIQMNTELQKAYSTVKLDTISEEQFSKLDSSEKVFILACAELRAKAKVKSQSLV